MESSVRDDPIAAGRSIARPRPWLTDAGLVLMSIIWGVNAIVMKKGIALMAPQAFNAVRLTTAAMALWILAVVARSTRPSARDVKALVGLGLIGNGFYQLLLIEGLARTRAGSAALILSASPAFVALFGRALGVERIGRRAAAGIALSMIGIAVVTMDRHDGTAARATTLGNAMVLAATACWSLFTVMIKPYVNRLESRVVTAVTLSAGTIPLVLLAAPALAATDWPSLPGTLWGAVLFSGLGSMVFAYLLWNRGVRTLGPTRTAMYGNMQPIFALVAAWMMLSEVPTTLQIAGTVGIISGVMLTRP